MRQHAAPPAELFPDQFVVYCIGRPREDPHTPEVVLTWPVDYARARMLPWLPKRRVDLSGQVPAGEVSRAFGRLGSTELRCQICGLTVRRSDETLRQAVAKLALHGEKSVTLLGLLTVIG